MADDEAMLRGALVSLLGLEPDLTIVAEVGDGAEAVAAVDRERPDVAVLDLEMPRKDGLAAAEQILASQLAPKVIIVTRHARPAILRRALATGVSAFVPKSTEAQHLAAIIRDVHAGRRYVDPDVAASALTEDDCPLTGRELEVLRAARTGASVAEIARAVHLAQGTVRNYLSAAMTKLGVSSRHAAVHTAWEQGWI